MRIEPMRPGVHGVHKQSRCIYLQVQAGLCTDHGVSTYRRPRAHQWRHSRRVDHGFKLGKWIHKNRKMLNLKINLLFSLLCDIFIYISLSKGNSFKQRRRLVRQQHRAGHELGDDRHEGTDDHSRLPHASRGQVGRKHRVRVSCAGSVHERSDGHLQGLHQPGWHASGI